MPCGRLVASGHPSSHERTLPLWTGRKTRKSWRIHAASRAHRGTSLALLTPVDVARAPEVRQRKRRRRLLTMLALLAAVAVASLALARLEPALPSVDRGTLVLDKVTRGSFTRQVPGL